MNSLLFLFAVLLILIRCSVNPTVAGGSSSSDNAKVMATVVYDDGKPASDALVRLRLKDYLAQPQQSQISNVGSIVDLTTDSNGSFFIDSIDPGFYVIEINDRKSHALALFVELTTDTAETTSLPVQTMAPYCAVHGSVNLFDSTASSMIISILGLERSAVVNSSGSFSFSDLPEGTFIFQFRTDSADYYVHKDTLDLIAGRSDTLDPVFPIPTAPDPLLEKVIQWQAGENSRSDNSRSSYWIPCMVASNKGTLLAFSEGRPSNTSTVPNDIVMKRSLDGGRSWSRETIIEIADGSWWSAHSHFKVAEDSVSNPRENWSEPSAVVDRTTGRIILLYALNYGSLNGREFNGMTRVFCRYSDDDGVSWSNRLDITDVFLVTAAGHPYRDSLGNKMPSEWGFDTDWIGRSTHFPSNHGIQLKSGTILFTCFSELPSIDTSGSTIMYLKEGACVISTDDGGVTWQYRGRFDRLAAQEVIQEPSIAQLDDGSLLAIAMGHRTAGSKQFDFRSTDGGATWSEAVENAFSGKSTYTGTLYSFSSISNGDDKNRLLFVMTGSTKWNLTTWLSYDNGMTWPISKQLMSGIAAYNNVVVLPNKTILVAFGEETGINECQQSCVRFNLPWLADGQDYYAKPE